MWTEELYRHTAGLVAQAGALAWLLSSTLKAFTGRMQPEFYTHLSTIDNSHEWLFGFWRHGIFWGWLLYGAYIALGVSVSIHWFSDALAGLIFGYIAYRAVVGKNKSLSS